MTEKEKAKENIDENYYALDWKPKLIKPSKEAIKQHKKDCEDELKELEKIKFKPEKEALAYKCYECKKTDNVTHSRMEDLKEAIKTYEKEGF